MEAEKTKGRGKKRRAEEEDEKGRNAFYSRIRPDPEMVAASSRNSK